MPSTDPRTDLPMASAAQDQAPDAAVAADETNELRDAIAGAIAAHDVIVFMKGTPEAPACGFSARTVAALQDLGVPFAAVDVLPDPRIRAELSALSNWPTIPQLFAHGDLIGGCDIVCEMHESGELEDALR
jgi:monothiol glutaredoxin